MDKEHTHIPSLDTTILKENIERLRKENGLKQEDLAKVLGLTQPDISKRLKPESTTSFTLDQVYILSQFFNTSIDSMIGNRPKPQSLTASDICHFLVDLIQQGQLKYFTHGVHQTAYRSEYDPESGYDLYCPHKEDVTYHGFYFPNYWQFPDDMTPEEYSEYSAEAQACGNDMPTNIKVNDFCQKFIDAYEKHEDKTYSDDVYQTLLDAYFKTTE